MASQSYEITDNGGLQVTVTDDAGDTRSVTLDPNVADEDLRMSARDTGGFEIEFPDGSGGRLVLAFIPDLSVPELSVQAGRPGNLLELAALSP